MWLIAIAVLISFLPSMIWLRHRRGWREVRAATPAWPYRKLGHRAPLLAPRTSAAQIAGMVTWQFHLLLVMFLTLHAEAWSPADVGLRADSSWSTELLFGVLLYAVFALCWSLYQRLSPRHSANTYYRAIRQFLPRGGRPVPSLVLICVLNPVTEQFWMRGVLVFGLGVATGSVPLAIGVGLVACLGAHLYQGKSALPYHAAFYAASVWVLYQPALGLGVAVAFHLGADVHGVFGARRYLKQVHTHLRALGPQGGQPQRPEVATHKSSA